MSLFKSLFGGKDKRQIQNLNERIDDSAEKTYQLFPTGEANRQASVEQALNIFGDTNQQELDTFRQGNLGAQEQLIQGQRTANDFLMGHDNSGVQYNPYTVNIDPSFSRQGMFNYKTQGDALQSKDIATQGLLSNIRDDSDLMLAAAEGKFGNFGVGDKAFYGQHLINTKGSLEGSNTLIGPDRRATLDNLLTKSQWKQLPKEERAGRQYIDDKNYTRLAKLVEQYNNDLERGGA